MVVLGVLVGSAVAIHNQGLVSFLRDIYVILMAVLGMGGALFLSFYFIHFLFCLLARDKQFFLDVGLKIKKIGIFKTALIYLVMVAVLFNFLMMMHGKTLKQFILCAFMGSFLSRIWYYGFGGLNSKRWK